METILNKPADYSQVNHRTISPIAIITLAFKQIIDANSPTAFEQQVFQASYQEFLLKSQAYNPGGKFRTFTSLKANDGRANSLHYKSGFAVDGMIGKLKNLVPAHETTLGHAIPFTSYQFEVIESDLDDKLVHKVAIIYFSGPLILHAVIGNYLVLSAESDLNIPENETPCTFLIQLKHLVSISTYMALS